MSENSSFIRPLSLSLPVQNITVCVVMFDWLKSNTAQHGGATHWSSVVMESCPPEPQSELGPEMRAHATYQWFACSATGSSNSSGYFSLRHTHRELSPWLHGEGNFHAARDVPPVTAASVAGLSQRDKILRDTKCESQRNTSAMDKLTRPTEATQI